MSLTDNISKEQLPFYYEDLRRSKKLEDMADFPSVNSYKRNPKIWRECIIFTQHYIGKNYNLDE